MANKTAKVPSIYGPVPVELTLCDGPECSTCVLDQYMVGWYQLSPNGISAATMASPVGLDPLDFCSLECLAKAVNMMTGHA